jgi:hypothetical protein
MLPVVALGYRPVIFGLADGLTQEVIEYIRIYRVFAPVIGGGRHILNRNQ